MGRYRRVRIAVLIVLIMAGSSGCISAGLDIGLAAADLVATMARQPNKTQCEGEGCENYRSEAGR